MSGQAGEKVITISPIEWAELIRAAQERAWREGHMTHRRLGPDDCECEAWNESECGCGKYGSNVITPNPYSVTPPGAPS